MLTLNSVNKSYQPHLTAHIGKPGRVKGGFSRHDPLLSVVQVDNEHFKSCRIPGDYPFSAKSQVMTILTDKALLTLESIRFFCYIAKTTFWSNRLDQDRMCAREERW
jgi:hypothetical protein